MPRKFLKRHSPSAHSIRENKVLSMLGEGLHRPNLWLFNRSSVARAFAIGLFCTWIPFPLQTVIAALLAIYYRANLPLSVALVFISNPVTIPPMFYFAYKLGSVMLGIELQAIEMDLSWNWFTSILGQIWQPLLFGCLILAIVSSAVGYFTINTLWRKGVKNRWKERTQKRHERKKDRASANATKEN